MNKIFYTFVLSALVLLSVQCNPKSQESDEQIENDSIIEYAELLSITCHDDYTDVKISNPWDSSRLLHRYILVPKTQNVPSNLPQGTVVRTPLSNTLVYASVHCLLEQLDALSQIGGVCDLSYIKTPALLSRAENGKLTDAGNSMSPDIERVMSLNPDAILLSPFENAGYGRIGKIGIPIIECADYLETSPLGRAEWIKFFGLLYGKEVEADSIFTEVEKNYTELRDKIGVLSSAPVVISELKSGSAWYMPGGKSYMARFFKDAGAAYPWSDNTETGSIPLSFETVFNRAGKPTFGLLNRSTCRSFPIGLCKRNMHPMQGSKPSGRKRYTVVTRPDATTTKRLRFVPTCCYRNSLHCSTPACSPTIDSATINRYPNERQTEQAT